MVLLWPLFSVRFLSLGNAVNTHEARCLTGEQFARYGKTLVEDERRGMQIAPKTRLLLWKENIGPVYETHMFVFEEGRRGGGVQKK